MQGGGSYEGLAPHGSVKIMISWGFCAPTGVETPSTEKMFKPPHGQIPEYAPYIYHPNKFNS